MDTAVVLAPATTFMSATLNSFKDPQTNDTALTFGPMSSIDEVLSNKFNMFTAIYCYQLNKINDIMHAYIVKIIRCPLKAI